MNTKTALDILKSALLLERRGKAFYAKVAAQAKSEGVREFFELMVDEEEEHIQLLSEQFSSYQSSGGFSSLDATAQASPKLASEVLTKKLKKQISAADFEAAAIAAAISMEKGAIQLYSERALAASDPRERDLYESLSNWERKHLDFLVKVNKELIEEVWNDNNFWPL